MKLSELIEAEINQVLGGYLGPDDAAADITARLHGCVKPLEWVDLHGDGSLYEVSNDHPLQYHAVINSRGVDGYWYFHLYPTLEAAKAAAQAHYAAQIIAGLDL